ncbi:MAG: hypothetical protein ACI85Q_001777 [Salibacteraceae bacterium]|jgi:hypothetical protein
MKKLIFFAILVCNFSLFAQPVLTADAGSDQVICSDIDNVIEAHFIGGQPSATGGEPPYTYSWSFSHSFNGINTYYASDFFNDTTLANPTLIWMAIGNWPEIPPFVLTVTDSVGNVAIDSVQLQMSYFLWQLWLHSYLIHQGDSVHMQYQPDVFGGTGPLTYLWRPNHGLIDSTNATFWTVPDTSIQYYVTATDSVGCAQQGQIDYIQVTVFPVGIEDGLPNINIKVYPNPASDYIQIERIANAKEEQFTLYDILGKEVLNTLLNSTNQTIEVSSLTRGSYSYIIGESKGQIILK